MFKMLLEPRCHRINFFVFDNFYSLSDCHGNLPVLNLLSASVTKNQHFRPCRKNYALDWKNNCYLLELSRRSLAACKVWGDGTAPRASCRSENWCFLCHAWSACVWDIVQTSIVWRFMGRFWCHFHWFFQKGLLCQVHYMVLIYVARWRQNFCEIAVKNYQKSKNRRKSLCAPFRIDSRDLKKIPPQ